MNKVDFRYDAAHNMNNIAGALIIASFALMAVQLYIGTALLIVTVIIGSGGGLLFVHRKGSFDFDADGVTFRNTKILYHDICGIVRETYDRRKVMGTERSPNQFRIATHTGGDIILRVSTKEEQRFQSKIRQLTRKIYGSTTIGLIKPVNAAEAVRREAQFEQEKPVAEYTLINAMEALSARSKINLNDTTGPGNASFFPSSEA